MHHHWARWPFAIALPVLMMAWVAVQNIQEDRAALEAPFRQVRSVTSDDEPGELVHTGPLVAQGYWRDAERTAQRFKPAPATSRYGGTAVWSGDTVRRDADGLLFFVGRDDAMIKTAGNRVSPTEVEDVAIASGLIYEAVAFGVPDARLGAAIVLIVRGKERAADEEGLAAYLRRNLPNFMQPQTVEWREELPRNPNGKLDRVAIAAGWTQGESV